MPAFKPRVILQTESYRVIASNLGPFEGKERADEIAIETKCKNGLDEPYWQPTHQLHAHRSGMTKDERLMLTLFGELSASLQRAVNPTRLSFIEHPTASQQEMLELSDIFEVLATMAKGQVVIPPDMPFDNRDNGVGLDMSPGLIGRLHKLFPGWPKELTPVQLVMALMERASKVLRQ